MINHPALRFIRGYEEEGKKVYGASEKGSDMGNPLFEISLAFSRPGSQGFRTG
jgi:hypothetical protein